VCGLGVEVLEVPEVVVSCGQLISGCSQKCFLSIRLTSLCLGNLVVRLRLASVDDIRELDRILDEENGDVVANDIPVALRGVELQGKATSVTDGVRATTASKNCRETLEHGSGASRVREHLGAGVLLQTLVHLEGTKGTGATGVDDTLGNALVVEAVDLLTAHVVFEELRTSVVLGCNLEPVIGVGLLDTKVGSDHVARCVVVDDVFLKVGGLCVAGGAIEAELL
jgi:hypothetical protein